MLKLAIKLKPPWPSHVQYVHGTLRPDPQALSDEIPALPLLVWRLILEHLICFNQTLAKITDGALKKMNFLTSGAWHFASHAGPSITKCNGVNS